MERTTRRTLQRLLLEHAPWLDAEDVGPRSIEAGRCQRCDELPRLLPTCGPAGDAGVCRACAEELGDNGWCAGHHEQGRAARRWAAQLPDSWPELVVLWWVATGELRPDPSLRERTDDLPASLAETVRQLPG